jgi:hypothetical protein
MATFFAGNLAFAAGFKFFTNPYFALQLHFVRPVPPLGLKAIKTTPADAD